MGSLPESRLVSVSREGGQVRLALAGRAVRDAVLHGLADDRRNELRKGLLRALARTPVPELAAEEARLLVDASDPAQALHVLAQSKAALPAAARARAQSVATRIATQHADLLATPAHRATLAATLLPGPDAKALATALIAHFPPAIAFEDLRAACLVADHLFLTRQLPAADAFAARAENLQNVPAELEARVVELRILRARAKLAMNQLRPGQGAPLPVRLRPPPHGPRRPHARAPPHGRLLAGAGEGAYHRGFPRPRGGHESPSRPCCPA